ncbi:hypothetical protein SESBI_00545 [Sesbania bispinosa]|nr:hypothetical protein SESBI_00545 [Sesbania bispinosa]
MCTDQIEKAKERPCYQPTQSRSQLRCAPRRSRRKIPERKRKGHCGLDTGLCHAVVEEEGPQRFRFDSSQLCRVLVLVKDFMLRR